MKNYLQWAVIRKDLTRFAPLWGLGTVFVAVYLLISLIPEPDHHQFMKNVPYLMAFTGNVQMLYGFLCALFLFGDLFDSRLCNMLHAMPLRREGWFISHIISGLIFCLIPAVTGALMGAVMLGEFFYGAFLWLGVSLLHFLFFFGAGVFSCLCAGTKLGATAVYALVNYGAPLLVGVVKLLCEPLLFGIYINTEKYNFLCPAVRFANSRFITVKYDNVKELAVVEGLVSRDWIYAGVVACVGILLGVLALVLYKKRNMETAGNMISLKGFSPVLTVIGALGLGLLLYMIGDFGFFLIGIVVGYFCMRMLVEKQVKVFRLKNFLGLGVMLLSIGLVLGTVWLDPVGITRYVPEQSQIRSVTVHPNRANYTGQQKSILTEKEDVDKVLQLHREALKQRAEGNNWNYLVTLEYTLRSGRVVRRTYTVPFDESFRNTLHGFYSRPQCVMEGITLEEALEHAVYLECYGDGGFNQVEITTREHENLDKSTSENRDYRARVEDRVGSDPVGEALIRAIYADCQAGTMSQWRLGVNEPAEGYILIYFDDRFPTESYQIINLTFMDNCENIMQVLAGLEGN